MKAADYNALTDWQKVNFEHCAQCDEWYDKRDLSTVWWHHDHTHRPDVQTGRGVAVPRLIACLATLHLLKSARVIAPELIAEWEADLTTDERQILFEFQRDQLLLAKAAQQSTAGLRAMIFDR